MVTEKRILQVHVIETKHPAMIDKSQHHHGAEHSHEMRVKKEHHHSVMQENGNVPMAHAGHEHHAMMINEFKRKFYIVLVLTIPIMLLSPMIQYWLNIQISFSGSKYILLLLSSIVFFYGGWPFLQGLISEIR